MRLPKALPDELLFSRLIRYCYLYAIPKSQLLKSLYGDDRASINPILTAGLGSISNYFSETIDNLLREQTLAPLFMHYYPYNKKNFETALASTDNYTAIRLSQFSCVREHTGITLKMCPVCVKEDLRQFGVAYWHRAHQVPAIESCCQHQLQLLHVSLPKRFKCAVGLPNYLETKHHKSSDESYLLAGFSKQVLFGQSKHISPFKVAAYKEKLDLLGYMTKCGRIRRVRLLADFYQFTAQLQYPSVKFLPSSDSDYKYITNLLYGHHSQHIFKYLIIGYWLSEKLKIRNAPATSKKHAIKLTKKIKLECLPLLKQGLTISAISKKIGKSRTYVRSVAYASGIETLLNPKKLNPSVREAVIRLAWKGFHRAEIARRVSLSTGSVEMLISSVNGLVEWRKRCKHESKRRRYKHQIIRCIQDNQAKIRKDIKRDCNAAFFWLYNHEPKWLESTLPEPTHPYLNPRRKK